MPKKIKLLVALCIVFNLLLVVGIVNFLKIPEVIECEILTAKYGHEFEDPELYKDASWIIDIDVKLKVLEYDNNQAVVYYTYGVPEENYKEFNLKYPYRASSRAVYRRQSYGKWNLRQDVATPKGRVVMPYWWHNVNGANDPLWFRLTWLVPVLGDIMMD